MSLATRLQQAWRILIGQAGYFQRYQPFPATNVAARQVDVWLPPGYFWRRWERYPVLYMHDGQNLFDPKTSYIGVDWGMAESMIRLIRAGQIRPAIIVGIWNSPARIPEYCAQRAFEQYLVPGALARFIEHFGPPVAEQYLAFITQELKPRIDREFRTLTGRADTFIMGSSMGGLSSLYAICQYPEVFGGAGCLSTSWSIGHSSMVDFLPTALPDPASHRIYFDYGIESGEDIYEPQQLAVNEVMRQCGFLEGENWQTLKFPEDDHSERSWRKRIHHPLIFLLGRSAPVQSPVKTDQ
jgi:predicted alpha/beta superfamily hydrolase